MSRTMVQESTGGKTQVCLSGMTHLSVILCISYIPVVLSGGSAFLTPKAAQDVKDADDSVCLLVVIWFSIFVF